MPSSTGVPGGVVRPAAAVEPPAAAVAVAESRVSVEGRSFKSGRDGRAITGPNRSPSSARLEGPMPLPAVLAPDAEPESAHTTPSEYATEIPRLREFASLPDADPRRPQLREDLVLAFLPVVEHLARRHARGGGASQ